MALVVKNLPANAGDIRDARLIPKLGRFPRSRKWQPTLYIYIFMSYWGFPGGSIVKNLPANAGDAGLIPGSGRFPGGENGNPLQHSCLETPRQGSLESYSPWGC